MERAPVRAPLIKNLEFKVGLLLILTALLAVGFIAYTLYARGAFQETRRLVLLADNAEGVSVGMDMTYSGFPIGRVKRMTLTDTGQVRVEMAVPEKDARWLRETSVFTLEKALVGGARIKAYSTNLADPPLQDGAERVLLTGDTTEEIPVIVAKVKSILENVDAMTTPQSSLNQSLASVKTVTERMAGEHGVIGGLMGTPENARKIVQAVDQTNALLGSLRGVSLRADSVLAKVDQKVMGQDGVVDEVHKSVRQINAILADTRESLKKVDAILKETQGAAANVNTATGDLGGLRAEVEDSLRKVNHLINEINRKWPFARDAEVKLP